MEVFDNSILLTCCLITALIFVTVIMNHTVYSQTNTSENFTKLFQQKYKDNAANARLNEAFHTDYESGLQTVYVKYESTTTILISGDLITTVKNFNSYLWGAMDLLKNQYGFKLQQVMTSGVGSEGNPTVVYILMTK